MIGSAATLAFIVCSIVTMVSLLKEISDLQMEVEVGMDEFKVSNVVESLGGLQLKSSTLSSIIPGNHGGYLESHHHQARESHWTFRRPSRLRNAHRTSTTCDRFPRPVQLWSEVQRLSSWTARTPGTERASR